MSESWVKRLLDRLIKLQDRYYPVIEEIRQEEGDIEGRCSILTVRGPKGGSYKLMVKNGRIAWADDSVKPIHHLVTSEDTLLDLLTGECSFREAVDKSWIAIRSTETGTLDVVEMEKWSRAFSRFEHLIRKFIGGVGHG